MRPCCNGLPIPNEAIFALERVGDNEIASLLSVGKTEVLSRPYLRVPIFLDIAASLRRTLGLEEGLPPTESALMDRMRRFCVSGRAYGAIKATLPVGSVVYPPERDAKGQYLLCLTEAEANRLAALRRRGESCADAPMRLAKEQEKWSRSSARRASR